MRQVMPAAKAEMTIVEAGARRDMGQLDAALRILEQAPLSSKSRESWVVRLRYAYADALVAAGRESEARQWFASAAKLDLDHETDAQQRTDELDGFLIDYDESDEGDGQSVDEPERDSLE